MLPPLSMEMAKTVAENPTALALDAFRYQVEEDGSVTASYLLRARGEVRFVRTYAPDEQLYLETRRWWRCTHVRRWRSGISIRCW